ncbi:MAG TPA: UDP-N-acetylmuramate--L-alanine ligase [Chloroflexota bacterium]|nr:UDP-N-acetylmuramate--L-alanine ligase [Chloroflexota bacterium]
MTETLTTGRIPPPGATVHLIGIGGAGMSSLAVMLREAGYRVTGSDLSDSATVEDLRARGIAVARGHQAENLGAPALVVRSSAVPESNPEVQRADELGIQVIKHAEMIGWLSTTKRTLAVAGTAGKTTTTAMLAWILNEAGLDPTVLVGGVLPALGSGARLGQSDFLVVEADEFDRRFLSLHPEVAVVTNVEPDHLDYYGSFEAIREAFRQFVGKVPDGGWLILCGDDREAAALSAAAPERSVTYGQGAGVDWRAAGLNPNSLGGTDFVVYAHENLVGQFRLRVPGAHNVLNALAATVAAGRVGVDFTTSAAALERFTGVQRRLENKGQAGGVIVIDDYSHQPTKARAALAALREHHAGRVVCLFQPHHYHRLSSLFDDFARAFGDADLVVVADVYAPAGRGPSAGDRTAADLAGAIRGPTARYGGSLAAATELVVKEARRGDLVVTMGAGDVTEAGPEILRRLTNRR